MQKLTVTEGIFDMLGDNKHSTLRKGKRDIELSSLQFQSKDEGRVFNVNVTRVLYCTFENLPEDIYKDEGFESMTELFEVMQRFYPDFKANSECTAIYFN